MSTFTDTSVRISLATPEDIRDLSQRALHFWVGTASPLWAPFWLAASFGVGAWSIGQGAARALGETLYDKDLPLAAKWPGFGALPKPLAPLAEEVVEQTTAVVEDAAVTTADALEKSEAVAAETAEATVDSVTQAATDAVEVTQAAVADVATTTRSKAAEISKKAAEATLDLLGQTVPAQPDTRPLIDPVTATPVVPAVAEAIAEPAPPMPKPAPRRPRKG